MLGRPKLALAHLGYAFAFLLSLSKYIIAFMMAGLTDGTLPMKIFNSLRYSYTPVRGGFAVIFVLLAASVFGFVAHFDDLPQLLGKWWAEGR